LTGGGGACIFTGMIPLLMSPKELSKEEEQRIYAVKTYIVNNLNEKLRVGQLARMAALGEQRFKDGFYRLFQMHPGEYLHVTRMQTARFLLRHTQRTMKDIAMTVGFREYKSFLRAYKKFFGVTAGSVKRKA
jgi:transcriptional regulator GlxA family with amidase domain